MTRLFFACFSLLLALGTEGTAQNAEASLSLFPRQGFHGWEEGGRGTTGWSRTSTTFRADRGAVPLLSLFSFRDHSLKGEVVLREGGTMRLVWSAESGDEVRLSLGTERCSWGGLREAAFKQQGLPQGFRIPFEVRRVGARWTVELDCKPPLKLQGITSSYASMRLGLEIEGGGGELWDLHARELAYGENLLEAGDLSSWWSEGQLSSWTIEDGVLRCKNRGGRYLATKKSYANFALRFRYRMPRGGNSGVGIRTPREGWPSTDGMELQLLHSGPKARLDAHGPLALYGNHPPFDREDRHLMWNWVHVHAEGTRITAWMNGVLCQAVDTARLPELRHRPLSGWIGFQDHGASIDIQDLYILELPATVAEPPPSAPIVVQALERVLEPAVLAELDAPRTRSRLVTHHLPAQGKGSKPVELAFEGPATLTRVGGLSPIARLSFWVDEAAEASPKGRFDRLGQEPPFWSKTEGPLHGALSFTKSLRVRIEGLDEEAWSEWTLLDAAESLPENTEVPPGWFDAVSYRRTQHEDGRVRSFAPLAPLLARADRIEPGARGEPLQVEGPGQLAWLGLKGPKGTLGSSSLWLEIFTDGKDTPDLSLPARRFFPANAAALGATSLLELGGAVPKARWAIPFANGVRVQLWNRGGKPLRKLALMSALEQLDDATASARGRLVSVQRERGSTEPLVLEGRGHWVAMILATTKLEQPFVVHVDGRPNLSADHDEKTWIPMWHWLGSSQKGEAVQTELCGSGAGQSWRYLLDDAVYFEKRLEVELLGDSSAALLAYLLR